MFCFSTILFFKGWILYSFFFSNFTIKNFPLKRSWTTISPTLLLLQAIPTVPSFVPSSLTSNPTCLIFLLKLRLPPLTFLQTKVHFSRYFLLSSIHSLGEFIWLIHSSISLSPLFCFVPTLSLIFHSIRLCVPLRSQRLSQKRHQIPFEAPTLTC